MLGVQSELILQPFASDEALIERLLRILDDETVSELVIVVAWARPRGLRLLEDALRAFRSRGGRTEIVVGIDEGGASVEGLELAAELFDTAEVLYDHRGGTFHPKIYLARNCATATLIIGSNNLTGGGLYFNYEAAHVSTLDLALAPDKAVLDSVEDYIARLRGDNTCVGLTADTIEALAGDPRFRVGREVDKSNSRRDQDAAPSAAKEIEIPIFGATKYARKAIRRPKRSPGGVAGGPEVGGSASPVAARWTKRMTRSDCGQPRPESSSTSVLRFGRMGHPINQKRWFREVLFSNANWTPDPTRPHREQAQVRFDVTIDGVSVGTHVLNLKFDATRGDPARGARQSNFTTDLKWGSLTPVMIGTNHVGDWVAIERLQDGSFRLIVQRTPPGSFLDTITK